MNETLTKNDALNTFVSSLKETLRNNLASVLLYGSAARSAGTENSAEAANINLLVVLKELSLTHLSAAEPAIRKARIHKIDPIFWSESELNHSWDVFPVELDGISKRRTVLFGRDPFDGIRIDRNHLRYQIEFEFRSKLFKLRSEWLEVRKSRSGLAAFLGAAGSSFQHLFPYAQELAGGKIPAGDGEVFARCARLKEGGDKPAQAELENLYQSLHDAAGRVVSIINNA